jgi:hypothetical protein
MAPSNAPPAAPAPARPPAAAPKWRQLGELSMSRGQLDAAATCLRRAADLSGLLLLHAAQVGAADPGPAPTGRALRSAATRLLMPLLPHAGARAAAVCFHLPQPPRCRQRTPPGVAPRAGTPRGSQASLEANPLPTHPFTHSHPPPPAPPPPPSSGQPPRPRRAGRPGGRGRQDQRGLPLRLPAGRHQGGGARARAQPKARAATGLRRACCRRRARCRRRAGPGRGHRTKPCGSVTRSGPGPPLQVARSCGERAAHAAPLPPPARSAACRSCWSAAACPRPPCLRAPTRPRR